ncbi:hypothetical protein ABEF79_06945 [Acinetobacter sp. ANC 7454]|uniref:hypothetical protein n=1 Tax=Acinetobacter thermotolerans TaxID=3151487 RepID=UPI00325BDC94
MTEPPEGATHIEFDGTYWKNLNNDWFFWREGWGWCQYVGLKNKSFFNKLTPV